MQNEDIQIVSFKTLMEFWKFLIIPAVLAVPILYEFPTILSEIQKIMAYAITSGDGSNGHRIDGDYHTIKLFVAVGICIFILLFLFLCFILAKIIYSSKNLRMPLISEYNKNLEEIKKLRLARDKQREYLHKLVYQLYSDSNRPRHNIISLHANYFVNNCGDLTVDKTITLCATTLPVQFYRFFINGDEFTLPASDMEDINFKVEATDQNCDVVYLLIENKDKHKTIIIWFLPEIQVGQKRQIRITYLWKGFLTSLIKRKRTEYNWSYTSFDNDWRGNFDIRYRFSEYYSKVVTINTGEAAQGVTLNSFQESGRTEVAFKGNNVLIGNTKYELTFVLE